MTGVSARAHATFHLCLPATPLSARAARRTARGFAVRAGITGRRLDEIELAVAESCANAVVHGLPDGSGTFDVTGYLSGDTMTVCTTDPGAGIGGSLGPGGLGLGLPLIAALSDELRFEVPDAGGTQVRMTFLVPTAVRPPARQ